MKTGKVSQSVLGRSVWKYCKELHPEVLQGPGAGIDSMTMSAGSGKEAVSCAVHPAVIDHPIQVRYALEHAINNLACSGSVPVCVMLCVLLPPEAQESVLKEIMAQAADVCGQWKVQIGGGHTEVSDAVRKPVLQVTAVGLRDAAREDGICVSEAEAGGGRTLAELDLLVAGEIAREGTALLALAREQELRARFSLAFVEEAKRMGESICIRRAAQTAQDLGAAAMHDVSQGGVFGALWELCERRRAGLDADLRKIPIRQESVEICEYFGLNPYGLLSGGALLIASRDGERMEAGLREKGIAAAVIGRLTDKTGRILHSGEEIRFLDKPAQDEFYKKGADFLWP